MSGATAITKVTAEAVCANGIHICTTVGTLVRVANVDTEAQPNGNTRRIMLQS